MKACGKVFSLPTSRPTIFSSATISSFDFSP
jgi:hypothetical protein